MIDNHKSLGEKFLKKGAWLYLFSFIIAPIGYIIKIIISNQMEPADVGILYWVISLVMLISAFNDFGMSESIKYFVPKFITEKNYSKVKSILLYGFIIQSITGIILASIFFFSPMFFSTEASGVLQVFAFYFLGISFFQILSSFFMGIQNTFAMKVSDFIRNSFILLSVLIMVFSGIGDITTYSYSWIIGLYIGIVFIINLFYFQYYKKYLKDEKVIWEKAFFKKILSYAVVACIGAQAGTLLGQIDMQMVKFLLGNENAGYYTNYISIISIPFMLIGPVLMFLFPVVSELSGKGETQKIQNIKKVFVKIFVALGLMFNIYLFVFAEYIATSLLGEKFIISGFILQYSVLFLVFNFLLQINFNIMAGIGKAKERAKILIIAVIFNFIGNFILLKTIGVAGAALATAFGWILIFILSEIELGKRYRITIDKKILSKNILFLGIGGGIMYYFCRGIFEHTERIESFFLLFGIGIIWFLYFLIINFGMVKGFVREIKKLKK